MFQFLQPRFILEASSQPYLAFHLYYVAELMPLVPPDFVDGAAGIGLFRIDTICVSVNFEWRMETF